MVTVDDDIGNAVFMSQCAFPNMKGNAVLNGK